MTKISRRSAVKGTAWAVPAVVVSTQVPAFAASGPCVEETVTATWSSGGSKTGGSIGADTYSLSRQGSATELTMPQVNNTNTTAGLAKGFAAPRDAPNSQYNSVSNWVALAQWVTTTNKNGKGQILTINFSQPVSDLIFYIKNIDGSRDSPAAYRDRVIVSTDGASMTTRHDYWGGPLGGTALPNEVSVSGEGTSSLDITNPKRATYWPQPQLSGGGIDHRGTVRIMTAPGEPVNSLTIFYQDSFTGNANGSVRLGIGYQVILISPITYKTIC